MSDIKKRLGRLLRSPINSLAGFVDVLRGVERVKEPTTSASAPADNDPKADITKFIVSNRTLQPAYRTTIAIYNALNGIINTPEELAAVPNAGLRESISEFPELNSTNSSPEKRASSRKFLAEKGLTYAQIAKEAAQEAHDAATKVGIPEADATVAHLPIVERRLEESLLPFYKNDLAGNRQRAVAVFGNGPIGAGNSRHAGFAHNIYCTDFVSH